MVTLPVPSEKPGGALPGALSEHLNEFLKRTQMFTRASSAAIALVEGDELVTCAALGASAPDVGARRRIGGSFTGMCVQDRKVLRCDNTELDPRVDAAACEALKVKSMVMVPIPYQEEVLGVLAVFSGSFQAFTATHIAVLKTMAEVLGDQVYKARPFAMPGLLAGTREACEPPPASSAQRAPVVPILPIETAKAAEARPPKATDLLLPAEDPLAGGNKKVAAPTAESVLAAKPKRMEPMPAPLAFGGNTVLGRIEQRSRPAQALPRRTLLVGTAIALMAALGVGGLLLRARTANAASSSPRLIVRELDPASVVLPGALPPPVATKPAPTPPAPEVRRSEAVERRAVEVVEVEALRKPAPPPEPLVISSKPLARAESEQDEVAPAPIIVAAVKPRLDFRTPALPTRPAVRTSNSQPGQLVHRVPPVYPAAALRMRIQGTVVLNVTIAADGSVTAVQPVSGQPMLRESAIAAVRQWRYRPAMLNGEPVQSNSEIELKFVLPAK
jgi:TonB family protein